MLLNNMEMPGLLKLSVKHVREMAWSPRNTLEGFGDQGFYDPSKKVLNAE
jgi:hypothetical protein